MLVYRCCCAGSFESGMRDGGGEGDHRHAQSTISRYQMILGRSDGSLHMLTSNMTAPRLPTGRQNAALTSRLQIILGRQRES
jgi:hypothetical protein